jgi:hypothetical protein
MVMISAIAVMSSGCAKSANTTNSTTKPSEQTTSTTLAEGFAIYLTKDNVPPSKMQASSHVDIAESPVIGINDIVTYNSANNEIKLTDDAFKRITSLGVSTSGKSFVVCVNKNQIYWGAFWTPVSSESFRGITIEIPFGAQPTDTITIGLGYPGSSFFQGEAPRSNAAIMDSLQASGKLINKINYLPSSAKGYELYSWEDNGQWNYTLITGTNRNKTVQEIITGNNTVAADGWVNIHVLGIAAVKELIKRIQPNENVVWWQGPIDPQFPTKFEFPADEDVTAIKAVASQSGYTLTVLK